MVITKWIIGRRRPVCLLFDNMAAQVSTSTSGDSTDLLCELAVDALEGRRSLRSAAP